MTTTTAEDLLADGSSVRDGHPTVEIDLSDWIDRARYTCPRGHRNWDRTNSHIWCQSCARIAPQDERVTPEYYELRDTKTGETVPWSAVRVVG